MKATFKAINEKIEELNYKFSYMTAEEMEEIAVPLFDAIISKTGIKEERKALAEILEGLDAKVSALVDSRIEEQKARIDEFWKIHHDIEMTLRDINQNGTLEQKEKAYAFIQEMKSVKYSRRTTVADLEMMRKSKERVDAF